MGANDSPRGEEGNGRGFFTTEVCTLHNLLKRRDGKFSDCPTTWASPHCREILSKRNIILFHFFDAKTNWRFFGLRFQFQ